MEASGVLQCTIGIPFPQQFKAIVKVEGANGSEDLECDTGGATELAHIYLIYHDSPCVEEYPSHKGIIDKKPRFDLEKGEIRPILDPGFRDISLIG